MVYFLGRDVSVVVSTESATITEKIGTKAKKAAAGSTVTAVFADAMNTPAFASNTSVPDLTGVDISVGAMDEDITYIGQKGTGKVEQKKEITVTLTRKKNSDTWDTIFNGPSDGAFLTSFTPTDQSWGARWGLDGTGAMLGDGLVNPKDAADGTDSNFGYRVHIMMLSGTELIAIPNCTLTAYTTTLGADSVAEESLEFTTQQSILNSSNGTDMNVALTTKAAF